MVKNPEPYGKARIAKSNVFHVVVGHGFVDARAPAKANADQTDDSYSAFHLLPHVSAMSRQLVECDTKKLQIKRAYPASALRKSSYHMGLFGESAGVRTLDLLIKSQLLYQLSYALSHSGTDAWGVGPNGAEHRQASVHGQPQKQMHQAVFSKHFRPWLSRPFVGLICKPQRRCAGWVRLQVREGRKSRLALQNVTGEVAGWRLDRDPIAIWPVRLHRTHATKGS